MCASVNERERASVVVRNELNKTQTLSHSEDLRKIYRSLRDVADVVVLPSLQFLTVVCAPPPSGPHQQ